MPKSKNRLKQIPSLLLIDFINFLLHQLLKRNRHQISLTIIDSTGFKYDEPYPLKILRGEQIRKIKSHVKPVVLSVHLKNGKRFILTAASGGSYVSEVKLGKKILEGMNSRDDVRTIGACQ